MVVRLDLKRKQDQTIRCPQEANFKYKNTNRIEVKGWEKIIVCYFSFNWTASIKEKNSKTVTRNKKDNLIIKRSIQYEDTVILNTYTELQNT